jgi:hypothetical protein
VSGPAAGVNQLIVLEMDAFAALVEGCPLLRSILVQFCKKIERKRKTRLRAIDP